MIGLCIAIHLKYIGEFPKLLEFGRNTLSGWFKILLMVNIVRFYWGQWDDFWNVLFHVTMQSKKFYTCVKITLCEFCKAISLQHHIHTVIHQIFCLGNWLCSNSAMQLKTEAGLTKEAPCLLDIHKNSLNNKNHILS